VNKFGAIKGLFSTSITFDIPSLTSNLTLSFTDYKRNISINASESFANQFALDDLQL
jgi:hypothetical protein